MENNVADLKKRIESLINSGYYQEGIEMLKLLIEKIPNDVELYSMYGAALYLLKSYDEAIEICFKGLDISINNFDLNYYLGIIYEAKGEYEEAISFYSAAAKSCKDTDLTKELIGCIERLSLVVEGNCKKKVVVFVKENMDSFLKDIISELSKKYIVKKIIVNDLLQIDEGMKWADICWFEWCDELIAYGSNLSIAKSKKIVCRLHRFEALTKYPSEVEWEVVDKLIIVADHLKDILKLQLPDIESKVKIEHINNGVNIEKFDLIDRKAGYNLAYVGYIHPRKNPYLLLQLMAKLVSIDKRYKLYIAGEFQDSLIKLYWDYQIKEMGLQKNIIFEGWQSDISSWLSDKNYVISTSIHESFGYGIAEAMCRGIKPVIHNFVYSKGIWNEKYMFNTIDEAVSLIVEDEYDSSEYREFIEKNYSLGMQMDRINKLMESLKFTEEDKQLEKIELMLNSNLEYEPLDDLTVMLASFNRGELLKDDFSKGLVLGQQSKVIVDDCSDFENRRILETCAGRYGVKDIHFNEVNGGVAAATQTLINMADTKHVTCCGDDDCILYLNYEGFKEEYDRMSDKEIIIPRHIINLEEGLGIHYSEDRIRLNGLTAGQLLHLIFMSGEMFVFNAGAIFRREEFKNSCAEKIFRVSEDYVALARTLAANPDAVIKVSENYTYVRRISTNTLSKTVNESKLTLNILSLIVSGYYCRQYRVIKEGEVENYIRSRGKILDEIFGFGLEAAEVLIRYYKNEITAEEFVCLINQVSGLGVGSIEELPREFVDFHIKR